VGKEGLLDKREVHLSPVRGKGGGEEVGDRPDRRGGGKGQRGEVRHIRGGRPRGGGDQREERGRRGKGRGGEEGISCERKIRGAQLLKGLCKEREGAWGKRTGLRDRRQAEDTGGEGSRRGEAG
jgi:hypothetical protein